MDSIRISVVGFGEVGACFSKALRSSGAELRAYDTLLEKAERDKVRSRMAEAGAQPGSLGEVVQAGDLVLSTVTTQHAASVAEACVPLLRPGQFYVDLNSTSPATKVQIARVLKPSGCDFVEGAILGAVGATGAETRILTGGEKGARVAELLTQYGLHVSYYSPEIGQASMFKMLRSIFSKGLETLLLELLIAGKRAGIDADLWADITDFMQKKSFAAIGANWIQTHAIAYERRYHEMVQVTETMREIGIEPIMTDATTAFFKRSLALDLDSAFPEKPKSFEAVVEHMEERLRKRTKEEG
ncbi:MAG: NAD(P)-dependent oxidoreductase [Acidobacteria bacterium]|nr:MAG: NAD(P)-dependent oxidoreductase [Acidobacteriota bacterium]